jgi:hypothetical protein
MFRPPAAPRRALCSPRQSRLVYAGVPKDRAQTELRIRRGLGAEMPRSVVLFAFPHAVIADVPLVAPFRYVVVENDVVIVDPSTVALADLHKEHKPTTTRSAAFDRPGGEDPEPPRRLRHGMRSERKLCQEVEVHLAHW